MSSSRGKALTTTKFNTSRVNKCPERALLCVLCGLRSMCRESIFSALMKRMIGLLEIKIELFVRLSRFLFWVYDQVEDRAVPRMATTGYRDNSLTM